MAMTRTQIGVIHHFWMRVLEVEDEDKRTRFSAALMKRLVDDAPETYKLYNDYDPWGVLLTCIREAGVECRGHLFSCGGIFPQKTGTTVYRSDTSGVRLKVGYGGNLGVARTVADVDRLLKGYNVGPGSGA